MNLSRARALLVALALGVGLAPACATATPAAAVAAAAPAEAPVVHAFTAGVDGFWTSTYWLDTGREVVVFDAQFTPALAEAMLADIRARTQSPVRWVVITHANPDKFDGAPVFQRAGAKVIASRATAAALPRVHAYKKAYFVGAGMFTEASYPALATVDETFSGSYDLPLDGASVRLVELAHGGVTASQTIALTDGAVIVGDLVGNRVHAWLEGAITDAGPRPDLATWRAALDETAALAGARTLLAGRGEPLPAPVALAEQAAYLARAEAVVTARVAALADARATLDGSGAGAVYQQIQADLAAAFPTYQHPELVGYGVYGLARALAAR